MIINEKREVTTDTTEIYMIIRDDYIAIKWTAYKKCISF